MAPYRGMTVELIKLKGDKGDQITAYTARPEGAGPFPGVVLVHHLPGWSELYIEMTRKFAHYGYLAICANLYERNGQGDPDDVAAKVRAEGGVPDAQVVGDTEAAATYISAPVRKRADLHRQPVVEPGIDGGLIHARNDVAQGAAGKRHTARPRALQGAIYGHPRDVRETASCSGPYAAYVP